MDYGASEFYNPQKIDKSAARAGLPGDYIAFGYALFLEEAVFKEMHDDQGQCFYSELRHLLERYVVKRTSSGFEPAAENSVAMSGGGEGHTSP